ncbi:MAG: iron-containing redox enzyme family protein [Pseudomonadota bacterium]
MTPKKKLHSELSLFNHRRLLPNFINSNWADDLNQDMDWLVKEGHFIEEERQHVQQYVMHVPLDADAFISWFENLKAEAPGQGDALFPWLAEKASVDQMRWFLQQEAAGEAGFDDLVAMTQLKLPAQAKLEMARNYWDEMGRGHENSMHGLMLENTVNDLNLKPTIDTTAWESLALANLMLALAINRRYAYQSIGALGAVEMTAPTRVAYVNDGLKRLNVDFETRKYFQLHATLDIKHSEAWNREVIYSLVKSNPLVALPIAEGALMRLCAGARCYQRYRMHFGIHTSTH